MKLNLSSEPDFAKTVTKTIHRCENIRSRDAVEAILEVYLYLSVTSQMSERRGTRTPNTTHETMIVNQKQ
jgi:hypothetical protein